MTASDGAGLGAAVADGWRVEPRPEIARCVTRACDTWIFAYGSLMWDPGFVHCEAVPAVMHGYHRRFCVYSHHHRGTPERPGLVLGLDRGGSCKGIAYRVGATEIAAALGYLWEREMCDRLYRLEERAVRLARGPVTALTFVVDRDHASYVGGLSIEETARLIHQGIGDRGTARDYLEKTVRELTRLGLDDGMLHRLARHVRAAADIDRT